MVKVRISSLIIILLFIALVPIYSFGWGWVNFSKNIILTIGGIYIALHIKKIKWYNMIPVILYLFMIVLSSWLNRGQNNFVETLRHVSLLFEMVVIPEIVERERTVADMAKTALYLLIPYWVISVFFALYIGTVPYGSGDVYFIGNKFNVAYLCILVIYLYGLRSSKKNKLMKARCILYLLWMISFIVCLRISAYTGVVMLLVGFVLYVWRLIKFDFKGKKLKWNFIRSPKFLLLLVVISGVIIVFIAGIFSIPLVANIITAINKTGTINSRLIIYSYLSEIIQNKPLLGYGFNTDIVKVTYAENAQNGLMKIIIENGFLGAFFFLGMIWSRIKYSKSVKSIACDWSIIWIVAYIFSAVVEITYSYHFLIILEFFFLQCVEIKEARKNEKDCNCYNYK